MEYKDKVVIVTGGAQGIGKCIAEEFRKQGALVEVIDKQEGLDHFVGDLSNKYAIEEFTKLVIEKYGKVDFIVNNALPLMKGIDECSYEEFEYALKVGVTAPFYMVKLLKNHLAEGASIVNFIFSRPHESASDRKLHGCERRYCSTHTCPCRQSCRQGSCQFHLTWMDRYEL